MEFYRKEPGNSRRDWGCDESAQNDRVCDEGRNGCEVSWYRVSYLDRAMTEGSSFSTVHRFVTMATLGYGRKHWCSRM